VLTTNEEIIIMQTAVLTMEWYTVHAEFTQFDIGPSPDAQTYNGHLHLA